MIAKVLGTGTGFSGKINYLFEGRMEDRKAEQKQAIVICHSENVRVPHSYTDLKGIERMKADFIHTGIFPKRRGISANTYWLLRTGTEKTCGEGRP